MNSLAGAVRERIDQPVARSAGALRGRRIFFTKAPEYPAERIRESRYVQRYHAAAAGRSSCFADVLHQFGSIINLHNSIARVPCKLAYLFLQHSPPLYDRGVNSFVYLYTDRLRVPPT